MSEKATIVGTSVGFGTDEQIEAQENAATSQAVETTTDTLAVNENGNLENKTVETAPPATEITPQEATPVNESAFEINFGSETHQDNTQTQNTATFDWKKELKNIDRKELLQELGFDEFDEQFANYRRTGGDPTKYLEAKAVDWTKVNDESVMYDELSRKYPNLTKQQRDYMFNKKYAANDLDDDDVKMEKQIALQADAYEARQKRVIDQQNFKIPESKTPQQEKTQLNEITTQLQQQQQQIEQARIYLLNHDSTKALIQNKRVGVDLGDLGRYNYTIDKPELLQKVIMDSATWKAVTSNDKGEPDVELLHELALHALNRKKYNSNLVNYGKSLGVKKLVDEGQNAQRPTGSTPRNTNGATTEKDAWKQARPSTLGATN